VTQVSTIGLDLAKMIFQAHGADASGGVAFRKTLRRAKVLDFFREQATRLMTIPGIGPIAATAIAALAPPMETFRKGRDFRVARPDADPAIHRRQTEGATSKRSERTIRRLLVIGAAALVRQTSRRAPPAGSWLARMLARKPRMLVITALANKMARTVWALLARHDPTTRQPGPKPFASPKASQLWANAHNGSVTGPALG
jgi:transposase